MRAPRQSLNIARRISSVRHSSRHNAHRLAEEMDMMNMELRARRAARLEALYASDLQMYEAELAARGLAIVRDNA